MTLPGLGVATPIAELLANYHVLIYNLPAVIEAHPNARVIRNHLGNLSIVEDTPDGLVSCGHIDVRSGDVEVHDEPWPTIGPHCPRCGGPPRLGPHGVCDTCAAAMGWDPHCEACHVEGAGKVAEVPHVDTCAEGAREIR